ncbi:MAG: dipeptidase [Austwickia sp.]|jgi:membrane dipeptidase|nr:dipeptidase [Austwickia sp.]
MSAPLSPGPGDRPEIRQLLADHPVIDGHNDLPWRIRTAYQGDLDRLPFREGDPGGHTDLPRLRTGGVGGQFWSVYVSSLLPEPDAAVQTLDQLDLVRRLCERYADRLAWATTADEVAAAVDHGRIASLIGVEGGHSIASSLGVLRMLHALGARYLTLTHNHATGWADSATDTPRHGGLTDFGRDVVGELNRLGMIVDLSHVAYTTMRDALAVTRAPVMFSHSSAYAVTDTPRNVPDDVLAALPGNGGVCMVAFVSYFVSQRVRDHQEEAGRAAQEDGVDTADLDVMKPWWQAWKAEHPAPVSTVADVVAHVEHVRDVAGIAHVGLGGDFDGADDFPEGLADVSGYPRLLTALADRGWSRADLAKLTGGNILRVLRAVEDVAARG